MVRPQNRQGVCSGRSCHSQFRPTGLGFTSHRSSFTRGHRIHGADTVLVLMSRVQVLFRDGFHGSDTMDPRNRQGGRLRASGRFRPHGRHDRGRIEWEGGAGRPETGRGTKSPRKRHHESLNFREDALPEAEISTEATWFIHGSDTIGLRRE